ncbi:hypothetical protein Tco_0996082 [Tanacetum coccineum]
MNINLEGRDTVMTDAPPPNVQGTQVKDDTHVIITAPINPEGIDTIFTLNTEATSLVDVLVTTIAEPPLLSATTLPPTPIITHLQQTLVPTPATVPSFSLQDLPNFGSLFGFDHRLKTLETGFSEFKQMNQFAEAVSFIPGIVDAYLANKMHEAVKTAIQLQSERLRDEAQAKNADFLNKLNDNIKKIIKDQVKEQTSLAIAANLSELELKKILIDKMESNKHRDDEDKDEEPSAGSNRGSKRRRAGKELESTSTPKEKTSKTSGKSYEGSKSKHTTAGETAQTWEPMHTTKDLEEPHIRSLKQELVKINRIKKPLSSLIELLTGPTFELMKGSCKSLVEIEYLFKEVYKATTEQLYWNNPEGQQYPHDLQKPLPLIPNSRGRHVIPFDHLFNNDLEYLSGGVSSRKYATSVTKTKAPDYGHIKWIKDLVPNRMWSQVPLGVEIYQKKLKTTNSDMYRSNLKRRDAYTAYSNPRGFIYQNKDKKNKLMRIDELHNFSDGTLDDVRTALNNRLKGIRMEYLPQTI